MKNFQKRIDDSVFFGLSSFTVKFIAKTYGLKTADAFVKAVYTKAQEVYGDFEVIQYPTYTEFVKK